MLVIGLTGGIAMGKSTIAKQFRALGAKVISADAIVHILLQPGTHTAKQVAKQFPETVSAGKIDRKLLGDIVFHDHTKLKRLERILHPEVVRAENRFIAANALKGTKLVVVEIPLLFETGAEYRFDAVVVATAPAFLQRQRAKMRPAMNDEKLKAILARQLPDRLKRRKADFLIHTGLGKAYSFTHIKRIVKDLQCAKLF